MKNDSSPCTWGADTEYIDCKFISSINHETTIYKLNVYFESGTANFDPADKYLWPEYTEY